MKKNNLYLVKFTAVSVLLGLCSPSIQIERNDNMTSLQISILQNAEAQRVAGRSVNRSATMNTSANVNRSGNINRSVNVNVNHRYYGAGAYGYYGGSPILAFTTAVAIGSMVAAATIPKTCTTVIVNGIGYKKCSSQYFKPFYQGDTLVYKAVASPYK